MRRRSPGSLRVVAGAKRGRRLKVPAGREVRPTAEKVREAIFDALGPIDGLKVLDLFAGTGALGLEALSRGAKECVFVEREPMVVSVLKANIVELGYGTVSTVIAADYRVGVRRLVAYKKGFDLLFVDPPYRMLSEVEVTLRPVLSALLAEDGVAVFEGDKFSRITLDAAPIFDRIYGDTKVMMIRRRGGR